jgi:two-component system chemotaxis response regulator CheB
MTTAGRSTRVVVVTPLRVPDVHLVDVVRADGDIEVVGQTTAVDEAIAMVARARPDVVVLDLGRPDDGRHLIEQVMAHTPTAILVLSSEADASSADTAQALVAGALLAIPKPAPWTKDDESQLRRTVRHLRGVPVIRHPRGGRGRVRPSRTAAGRRAGPVVALAASTGGPAALAEVLSDLDGLAAPVLVVQHLHPEFVAGFVAWMSRVSVLPVVLARHGERLRPGRVYIGPGNKHLRLDANERVELSESPLTVHRPSADELFHSVAVHAGARGIGVVLTGMGDDGAHGLLALKRRGGLTLAQDEQSSVVYGMPQAASRLGAARRVLPLTEIAGAILRAAAEVPA